MRAMVDKILRQYGVGMTLVSEDGERTVWGFFQPVRSKSFQNMIRVERPLGMVERGQYVYIGSAEEAVREGDCLNVDGRKFVVQRTEPYYHGSEAVYLWGLCVEKGGEEAWGS